MRKYNHIMIPVAVLVVLIAAVSAYGSKVSQDEIDEKQSKIDEQQAQIELLKEENASLHDDVAIMSQKLEKVYSNEQRKEVLK
ncbi:hypothetical protein [Virgibacillus sp. CBA3643]|uniref:hypothetical protein n=1 Tax=Virgibacillus sp. CBA3643 TaxID=2942278 RepID=UPI0035A2D9B8